MTYLEEIKKGMKLLSDNGYWIIGQNVKYGGTSLYHTTKDFFEGRKCELPVMENCQAGIATGMSLTGYKVLSIYPRFDFFLLALDHIINHLDKFNEMSLGQFKPKVIIRVCVGSTSPLMPGPQHSNNYTEALKKMVTNIDVVELTEADMIVPAYIDAMNSERSVILIEHSDKYNSDFAMTDIKESKDK